MMTSATSLQLNAFLAIPATLRSVLLSAVASRPRPECIHARHVLTSSRRYASSKYPNVAALVIPEFRTSPMVEITPDDLFKHASLFSAPGQPLEEELLKLYIRNPATFIHAESDFYKLKKNTRTPEVCVLGRSNVGKSSFVNALAQRSTNVLAYVSSKSGKTRSINAYGFGPAPTTKQLQAQGDKYKDEDLPTHTFHLVDMPGYGHASLKEWGKNITLYMSKRNAVKGAILLIDAEVGPKDSDYHLLELLSDAQLKTAVVLTKADKVKKGLVGLRETCEKVREGLYAMEARTTEGNWTWERDIYVTAVGARDSAVARSTVTTARLAVARLAGLVKDQRPKTDKNTRWSGKVVSFDDLLYAPSKPSAPEANEQKSESIEPVQETPFIPSIASSSPKSTSPKSTSSFDDLDQAVTEPYSPPSQPRNSTNASYGSRAGRGTARASPRRFHSSAIQTTEPPDQRPTADQLKALLDEFLDTLTTDTPRDWVRRLWQERERYPRKFFNTSFEKIIRRQARRLRRRFPVQTARFQDIFLRRLMIEERRSMARAAKEARALADMESVWHNLEGQPDANEPTASDEAPAASSRSERDYEDSEISSSKDKYAQRRGAKQKQRKKSRERNDEPLKTSDNFFD